MHVKMESCHVPTVLIADREFDEGLNAVGKNISSSQLAVLLRQGALLVDVREQDELVEGATIDGGQHWPLSSFGMRKNEIPQNKPTVFYCRSGMRSMQAAEIASNWTDQEVYFLQGGVLTYADEGNAKG